MTEEALLIETTEGAKACMNEIEMGDDEMGAATPAGRGGRRVEDDRVTDDGPEVKGPTSTSQQASGEPATDAPRGKRQVGHHLPSAHLPVR